MRQFMNNLFKRAQNRNKIAQRQKTVTLPCPNCDGTKVNPDNPMEVCGECNGKGKIQGTISQQ